jgi:hypothetical protein
VEASRREGKGFSRRCRGRGSGCASTHRRGTYFQFVITLRPSIISNSSIVCRLLQQLAIFLSLSFLEQIHEPSSPPFLNIFINPKHPALSEPASSISFPTTFNISLLLYIQGDFPSLSMSLLIISILLYSLGIRVLNLEHLLSLNL